jgi:hypothetical protein
MTAVLVCWDASGPCTDPIPSHPLSTKVRKQKFKETAQQETNVHRNPDRGVSSQERETKQDAVHTKCDPGEVSWRREGRVV